MAIRQTRIFVRHTETADWAETLIGRVFRQMIVEFQGPLRSFWFSRYVCLIGNGEDRDDCDFDVIPDEFKQAFPGTPGTPGTDQPGHRSLRFRFEIEDASQAAFEAHLQELLHQYSYAISDIRDYDQITDTGGERLLAVENRQPGRDVQRARLVTQMYQVVSELVIDALVGPDPGNRFHIEHNDHRENPNGSTFESLHHLFCNITQVPVSILVSAGGQAQLRGTFSGPPRGQRPRTINGQPVTEVYLTY